MWPEYVNHPGRKVVVGDTVHAQALNQPGWEQRELVGVVSSVNDDQATVVAGVLMSTSKEGTAALCVVPEAAGEKCNLASFMLIKGRLP